MGNYDTRTVNFRQSLNDFPLTVALGKNTPSFGLHRFKQGLRFVPLDDEGFTLRGDRRRLLYKGRRRSHRFTILGDCSFEYDCILLKEPESNTISLLMEGADNFDFFRQPDFLKEPLLAGSYAVYKKETLLGEGTGKLCHIHRPQIIDSRGRRCWGDLSVVGNELRVTIPEKWLSEAAYPVVVDPTIGTSTVGSQNKWVMEAGEPPEPLMFELSIPVNRFLVSETINGLCTAYAYVNQDDYEAGGRPVIYSDNGNKPQARKSTQEGFIDLRVISGKPVGWRAATFKSNGSIANGSYIWFGVFCEYFWYPRFDWGANCYADWWEAYDSIPNNYPIASWSEIYNFKLSMYFTYTSAQNYVRTLTQGVKLTDTRKLTVGYKRVTAQTVKGAAVSKGSVSFLRKCLMNAANSMSVKRLPVFTRSVKNQTELTDISKNNRGINRKCEDTAKANEAVKKVQTLLRMLKDNENVCITDDRKMTAEYKRETTQTVRTGASINAFVSFLRQCLTVAANNTGLAKNQEFCRSVNDEGNTSTVTNNSRELNRKCDDNAAVSDEAKRRQGFYRGVTDSLKGTDNIFYPVLFVRSVHETQGVTGIVKKWGDYFRGLYVEAGNIAETVHRGEYYRREGDTVLPEGSVFRHLFIFVRILTASFVRDFILRRFLVAREELVLKSCITREFTLESKID